MELIKRILLFVVMLFFCWTARAANPSFSDFDTNYFRSSASSSQPKITLTNLPSSVIFQIGTNYFLLITNVLQTGSNYFVLNNNGTGTNEVFWLPVASGSFQVKYSNNQLGLLINKNAFGSSVSLGLSDGSKVFNYIPFSIHSVDALSVSRDGNTVLYNDDTGGYIYDQSNNIVAEAFETSTNTEMFVILGGASWSGGKTTIDPVSGKFTSPEIDAATAIFNNLWVTNVSGPVSFLTNTPANGNGTVTMNMLHASDLFVTNANVTVSIANPPASDSADAVLILSNSLASGSTILLTSSGFAFLTNGVPTRNAYLTNLTAKNQVAYLTVHCQASGLINAVLTQFYDP